MQKKKTLEKIYQKLSEFDQQIVQVVLIAEKQSLSTLNNIHKLFYSTRNQEIDIKKFEQSLNRLEKVGLLNKFEFNKNGISNHVWRVTQKAHSIIRPKFSRIGLLPMIFLPITILSIVISYFLLGFLDNVVHGDLYGHGLVFSYEWAGDYWNLTGLIRTSFLVLGILVCISLIIAVIILKNSGIEIKSLNCAIIISGIAGLSFCLFLFTQLDSIVNSDLYSFGLQFSYQWFEPYSTYLVLIESLLILGIASNFISFLSCLFAKPRNQLT
jgi:hypothetical protein